MLSADNCVKTLIRLTVYKIFGELQKQKQNISQRQQDGLHESLTSAPGDVDS